MARRGQQAAAKRKREIDKRAKREVKRERRARRAEERAEVRDARVPELSSEEDQ